MARVQYGSFITELAGSIGGTSFQKNHSGNTARAKAAQKFFPSTLQSTSRSDFANIATLWRFLSLTDQTAWNAYAIANPITDKWGLTRTLTGFQYFMLSNLNLQFIGQTLLTTPPAYVAPDIVPAYEVVGFTNSLHIDFYPAINFPNSDLLIFATAPVTSTNVSNRKNLRYIGSFSQPNAGIFDVTTMYENAFGITWSTFFNYAQCNIVFQLVLINRTTGVSSPYNGYVFPMRNYPTPIYSSIASSMVNMGNQGGENTILSTIQLPLNICLAGSAQAGHIFRSTDNGDSWSDLGQMVGEQYIYTIAYLENGICLAGTTPNAHVLRSTDYGATWTDLGQQFGLTSILSLCYIGNGICLAGCGATGHILRSTDYGATWTDLGQQFSQTNISSIIYLENGICLAGSQPNGYILRSTDFGTTWSNIGQLGSSTNIFSLCYCGNGICLAGAVVAGHLWKSSNYGLTWSDKGQVASQGAYYSLCYLGSSYILGGTGPNGHLIRSSDYGDTWTDLGQQFSQTRIYGISHNGHGNVLAGAFNGGLIIRNAA